MNDKLEAVVVCGVANATGENADLPNNCIDISAGGGSDYSTIQSIGTRRKAQSGNVGDFLSNKKLQISFKSNK